MQLSQWFYQGGSYMWYVFYIDIVVVFLMLALLVNDKRDGKNTAAKILFLVLAPTIVGAFGHYIGYVSAVSAIASADPTVKEELFQEAMSYAIIPTIFGGASSLILLLLGLLGLRYFKGSKKHEVQ